jgi:hypothetical protein
VSLKKTSPLSFLGCVGDKNFPAGTDFIVQCQVRCHKPDNPLSRRKYRPLENVAEFSTPYVIEAPLLTAAQWLVPVLHPMI